jgi:predicted dithiol-disulfide oxidoreductase (DUF899 family)
MVEAVPMWPIGASAEYVAARQRIARAERALRDQIREVAVARRALPAGAPLADYVLAELPADLSADGPVRSTRLSELFGEYPTLVVYHLMYAPDDSEACPMCSMWVDGFHGVSSHLAQHCAFAVVAKAPPPRLRAWAAARGWAGLRILSSYGTSFNADLRAERPDGAQRPMASVLVRAEGEVRHFYTLPADHIDGTEGGMDLLCPVWNVLDLLPAGRGLWYAGNDYVTG